MAMELTTVDVTATDSDIDTPPRTSNATKPTAFLAYSNGNGNAGLKRPHCAIPNAADPPPVSYKECMRNHAAGIGGHALDGCCEFMQQTTTDLRCAACGCHRNFHRRDPDDPAPLHRRRDPIHPEPETVTPATRTFYSGHHLSLKKTVPDSHPARITPATGSPATGKKRFRTKFSQEQKEKMYEFSEKLGWKLQRIEKGLIEGFCKEIGVGKEVLKVWMHNNKNTLGRKENNVNGGDYMNAVNREQAGNGNGGEGLNGNGLKGVSMGSGDGSFSSSG